MEQKLTSLELARQTLIKLSKIQNLPTPENYHRVYEEISGIRPSNQSTILNTSLERVLQEKGKNNPQYTTVAKKIATLIEKQDSSNLEAQLHTLFPQDTITDDSVNWGALLRHLLKQLDVNHSGLTLSHKKDGINRVIIHFGNDSIQLAQKIQALITSWGNGQSGIDQAEMPRTAPTQPATPVEAPLPSTENRINDSEKEKIVATAWRDMLIRTINSVVVPQFTEIPSTISRIEALVNRAQAAQSIEEIDKLNEALKSTLLHAEIQNDSQQRMQEAPIQILRLLISSMGELTIEDKWLHGQLAIVQEIISKPLNIDAVYNAESNLKELIFKQSNIKPSLLAAKETLRSMVSTFGSRLADITVSTGSYQSKIQTYHDQINATENIAELSAILESLVGDISAMNEDAKQNHEALQETQEKVESAEKQIHELTVKLDYISKVAHEDFLTGALNRRGMDDALAREFERADRHNTALSLAILDIDHFKKINATLGHSTGDKALAHLAKVVKSILRSTDVFARCGGEEFVILLPGSTQEDAVDVISGLQRELTKNLFLHNNERVLITFSAGVTERMAGEDVDSVLSLANAALYLAKQSGRNCVIGAEPVANKV